MIPVNVLLLPIHTCSNHVQHGGSRQEIRSGAELKGEGVRVWYGKQDTDIFCYLSRWGRSKFEAYNSHNVPNMDIQFEKDISFHRNMASCKIIP